MLRLMTWCAGGMLGLFVTVASVQAGDLRGDCPPANFYNAPATPFYTPPCCPFYQAPATAFYVPPCCVFYKAPPTPFYTPPCCPFYQPPAGPFYAPPRDCKARGY